MKLEEFLEKCNCAPWSLEEVAHYAAKINDLDILSNAASDFLQAKEKLDQTLEVAGFEWG